MPEEGAVIGNVRFRTFNLEALIALASGLAILVLDAVVARDNRYGFAEPFAKLFVKFARSSEAVATWS
ncbi:putative membrane protein [Sinorhizobium meliloti Rm41]|nr:putative membrane protein [Sinorhizobium meliloti Rm41]